MKLIEQETTDNEVATSWCNSKAKLQSLPPQNSLTVDFHVVSKIQLFFKIFIWVIQLEINSWILLIKNHFN